MTPKPLLSVALLCLALAGAALAADPGARTAPPAAVTFRLGAFELTALRDSRYVTPNDGADFGSRVGPKAVAKLLAAAGAPVDAIALDVDALVVRTPEHVILIDTGFGPSAHGVLRASLALAGVSPGEITDVLITHAHPDHVGGLVDADGKPAFPRARIWLSTREWKWMNTPPAGKLAAAIAPQVTTFEPGHEILPGVTTRALYGHTPGHVGYEIVSHEKRIEDFGDTAHSSIISLARPEWTGGIDEDPKAGTIMRRRELGRLAARRELVFSPHFPFPGVGWIVRKGDGFGWKPDQAIR